MSFTSFKDNLPKGQAYPIGLEALDTLFPKNVLAVYFISSATWVRQVYPIDGIELPIIRIQKEKPFLRIRNEKVKSMVSEIDEYVIVYSLPQSFKNEVVSQLHNFLSDGQNKINKEQLLFYSNNHIRADYTLPNWI